MKRVKTQATLTKQFHQCRFSKLINRAFEYKFAFVFIIFILTSFFLLPNAMAQDPNR